MIIKKSINALYVKVKEFIYISKKTVLTCLHAQIAI